MIGVFDGVIFYIVPSTARRLGPDKNKLITLLETGNAVQKPAIDNDVTHVICDSCDYDEVQQSVSDTAFCSFVTPKWVFISNTLHYSLPVVCLSRHSLPIREVTHRILFTFSPVSFSIFAIVPFL